MTQEYIYLMKWLLWAVVVFIAFVSALLVAQKYQQGKDKRDG